MTKMGCCANRETYGGLIEAKDHKSVPLAVMTAEDRSQADKMTREHELMSMNEKREVVDSIVAQRESSVQFDDIYRIF